MILHVGTILLEKHVALIDKYGDFATWFVSSYRA